MDAGTWDRLSGRSRDCDVTRHDTGDRRNVDEAPDVGRRRRLLRTMFDVPDKTGGRTRRGRSIDSQSSSSPSPSTCGDDAEHAFSVRRHFVSLIRFSNYVTILLQSFRRQLETILGNFLSLLRYSTFPFSVRSGDVTSRRSPSMKVFSSPILYLLVNLIFFAAFIASSPNGVAIAASVSSRASPSSSAGKVFNGDPVDQKNFDWTVSYMTLSLHYSKQVISDESGRMLTFNKCLCKQTSGKRRGETVKGFKGRKSPTGSPPAKPRQNVT